MSDPYNPVQSGQPEQPAPPAYSQPVEYPQAPQQPQAMYPGQPVNPGYPQQGVPYGPVPTDGFAIASLVLGLIGGSVLAIIFGILSLGRTKDGMRTGRGMAIAGIVLGALWFVAIIFIFVVAANTPYYY